MTAADESPEQEFTYADIAAHTSKKDAYVVIHDLVYDVSRFVDEHPGGEEVLLDVAGQDSTEAFEDVGHSDEAREILRGLLIGKLKRVPGDPTAKIPSQQQSSTTSSSTTQGAKQSGASSGMGLYALMLLGGLLAFVAWKVLAAPGRGEEKIEL